MATVKKTQLKLQLSDGKSAVINLPAPKRDTFIDPETGDEYSISMECQAIHDAYESDDGAKVVKINVYSVVTTTTEIANEHDDFYND